MLLHAGLLLSAGEVSRAAYVLVIARQNPKIEKDMRVAMDDLLDICQVTLGKAAQHVGEAAKLHDAGSAASAAARLRELLLIWPANALAHYELALAIVSQQYSAKGAKPPARARLSIHSDLPPGNAALESYARARAHDPLLIRAYQGGEAKGVDVFMTLGKKVRPLWDQLARELEAKIPDDDLESLTLGLQEIGLMELAIAVRQVLIAREGGYDDHDRKLIVAALRALVPQAADAIVARLASPKAQFIKIVLP
jgi:hypothetical protein